MTTRHWLRIARALSLALLTAMASATVRADDLPLAEIRAFTEVFGKIQQEYVDPTDAATMLRDAIYGMLHGLDPHSAYLDADAFAEMQISTQGKFHGLGVEITSEKGFIEVVAPIDGTPAERAGIQSGDRIIAIDGASIDEVNLYEAIEKMRGPPGSRITLTIERPGKAKPFDVTIVRAVIAIPSVRGRMLDDAHGYVRITNFQVDTADDLRDAIGKLRKRNMHGLVLDLRDNPGGILHGAIDVGDVFLPPGVEIVSTRERNAERSEVYRARMPDFSADMPLVALVNRGTASAAEIVAGALQDNQRAILLGTRTFGKGSVQNIIPLSDGGALKLTTARYYTPSKRSIQARGIAPDIVVAKRLPGALSSTDDRAGGEADLYGHLQNEDGGARNAEGKAANDDIDELATHDNQVAEALHVLKGMGLVKLRSQSRGEAAQ